MQRILAVCTLALLLITGFTVPAAVAGQTEPVPIEDTILRITEGEGWNYALDANGQPIESMVPMMTDGEPQLEFAPPVLDLYNQYQLLGAYAWSTDVLPDSYEPISTTIEIRVMSFASTENAAAFLEVFYDQIMDLSAPEANVTAIDPLPDTDLNLLGITSMVDFSNYESGDSMGMAGSARYLAQIDNSVISVQVTGPLVDYNFDVAFSLLNKQVSCVTSTEVCDPIAMPTMEDRWELTEKGLMFVTEGDAENEWARWIFPLEEPVTHPAWSATLP